MVHQIKFQKNLCKTDTVKLCVVLSTKLDSLALFLVRLLRKRRNGKDNLDGTDNRDLISGGNGKDTLSGLDGDDTLNGDNGRDLLNGGNGDDVLNGGRGRDTFVIAPGQGTDIIEDFNRDTIGLADDLSFIDLTFSGSDILFGEEILATLTSIDTTNLSESDFTTV